MAWIMIVSQIYFDNKIILRMHNNYDYIHSAIKDKWGNEIAFQLTLRVDHKTCHGLISVEFGDLPAQPNDEGDYYYS